jgi:hypothetical protein
MINFLWFLVFWLVGALIAHKLLVYMCKLDKKGRKIIYENEILTPEAALNILSLTLSWVIVLLALYTLIFKRKSLKN